MVITMGGWYRVFNSIAIGYGAKAKSDSSLAIGRNAGNAFVGDIANSLTGRSILPSQNDVYIGFNAGDNYRYNPGRTDGDGRMTWGSIFLGERAGTNSDTAGAIMIGSDSGVNQTGYQNILIGDNAGIYDLNKFLATQDANLPRKAGERNVVLGNQNITDSRFDKDYINDTVSVGTMARSSATQGIAIGSAFVEKSDTYDDSRKNLKANAVKDSLGAIVEGKRGIAIGSSNANQKKAIIDGGNKEKNVNVGARAFGDDSIALGTDTTTAGANSIVMGKNSRVEIKDQVISKNQKDLNSKLANSMVIGSDSNISSKNSAIFGNTNNITAQNSYAIGNNNEVTSDNTYVLGSNVKETTENSLFLGNDSAYVADGDTTKGTTEYTQDKIGNLNHKFSGGDNVVGVVSVGSQNQTRRIQNVAPGLISDKSTDAINGSQLYATNQILSNSLNSLKDALGGNANIDQDSGAINFTNIGGTGKNNINDAINAINVALSSGGTGGTTIIQGGSDHIVKYVDENFHVLDKDGDGYFRVDDNGNRISKDGQTLAKALDGKYYLDSDVDQNGKLKDFQWDDRAKSWTKTEVITTNFGDLNGGGNIKDFADEDGIVGVIKDGKKANYVIPNGTLTVDGHTYTIEELKELDKYAAEHGQYGAQKSKNSTFVKGIWYDLTNEYVVKKDGKYYIKNKADNEILYLATRESPVGQKLGFYKADDLQKDNKGKFVTIEVGGKKVYLAKNNKYRAGEYTSAAGGQGNDFVFEPTNDIPSKVGYADNANIKRAHVIAPNNSAIDPNIYLGNVKGGILSNDAVNVAQLKKYNERLNDILGGELKNDNVTDGSADPYIGAPTNGWGGTGEKVLNDALTDIKNSTDKGLKFNANAGSEHTAKLGSQISIKGDAANTEWSNFDSGKNIMTKIDTTGNIVVGLSKDLKDINSITTEKGGDLTIKAGDETYTFDNGDNKGADTNVVTNKDLKEAVKQINTQVGSVNLNIAGDKSTKGSVNLKTETLNINGDGKNITTSVKNGEVKVALNDEINLGNDGESKTKLGNDGLTITQADGSKGPSITADGVAMNDKQITGLKSGLDGLGKNGKDGTIADYKKLSDAEKEKYKHNAATIGDLATVDGKIVNVSTNINNIIGNTYIKDDGNGNKIVDLDKIKKDLVTNSASGQNQVVADGKGAIDMIVNSIKNINTQGTRFFHVNDGQTKGTGSLDKDDSSADSKGGVAIGIQAKVDNNAKNAISIGTNSIASVAGGIALGSSSVANRTTNLDGYIPTGATADQEKAIKETSKGSLGVVSVGETSADGKTVIASRQITGVAAGTQDSDAVNVAQLKAVQRVSQSAQWIAADNRKFDKNGKIVDNNIQAEAKGVNSVAIGAGSNTKVVSNGRVIERPNTVSVGGINKDGTVTQRTISNVAPGVLNSDAATMGQLRAGLNDVYGKLGEYKKDASAGTASALAVGNLPQATIPGKGMVSLGSGFYDGESAMAIGLSKMSDSGKWVFKGSASYDSQEKAGAALSVGFHF